jgi:hypothetical protein
MNINGDITTPVIQELYVQRGINIIPKEWKYCLLYFLIVIVILILTAVNLVLTIDSFDGWMYVYDANALCTTKVLQLEICMKTPTMDCSTYSKDAQNCIDEVENFNKRCSIYITEFCECKKVNKITNKTELAEQCSGEIKDIINCNYNSELKIDPSNSLDSCK